MSLTELAPSRDKKTGAETGKIQKKGIQEHRAESVINTWIDYSSPRVDTLYFPSCVLRLPEKSWNGVHHLKRQAQNETTNVLVAASDEEITRYTKEYEWCSKFISEFLWTGDSVLREYK